MSRQIKAVLIGQENNTRFLAKKEIRQNWSEYSKLHRFVFFERNCDCLSLFLLLSNCWILLFFNLWVDCGLPWAGPVGIRRRVFSLRSGTARRDIGAFPGRILGSRRIPPPKKEQLWYLMMKGLYLKLALQGFSNKGLSLHTVLGAFVGFGHLRLQNLVFLLQGFSCCEIVAEIKLQTIK